MISLDIRKRFHQVLEEKPEPDPWLDELAEIGSSDGNETVSDEKLSSMSMLTLEMRTFSINESTFFWRNFAAGILNDFEKNSIWTVNTERIQISPNDLSSCKLKVNDQLLSVSICCSK